MGPGLRSRDSPCPSPQSASRNVHLFWEAARPTPVGSKSVVGLAARPDRPRAEACTAPPPCRRDPGKSLVAESSARSHTHAHARTHARTLARSLARTHARTHARAHTLETRGRPASRDCLATRCRGPHASVQVGISESRSSEMPERRQHSQAPGSRGRSLRPGVRTVRAGNRAGSSGPGSQDPRALAGGPAESGPGLPVPAARPNCQWRP